MVKKRMIRSKKSEFYIRKIRAEEIDEVADLVARLKKLNGEFDPLLKTSDKVEASALKTLREGLPDKNCTVLVALSGSRVVGMARAMLRDRIYYEPRKEGTIIELYIMPEFRRGNLGRDLFNSMVSTLKKEGAQLITAEFPSQNQIAHKFYTRLGYRSLTNVYAKAP